MRLWEQEQRKEGQAVNHGFAKVRQSSSCSFIFFYPSHELLGAQVLPIYSRHIPFMRNITEIYRRSCWRPPSASRSTSWPRPRGLTLSTASAPSTTPRSRPSTCTMSTTADRSNMIREYRTFTLQPSPSSSLSGWGMLLLIPSLLVARSQYDQSQHFAGY